MFKNLIADLVMVITSVCIIYVANYLTDDYQSSHSSEDLVYSMLFFIVIVGGLFSIASCLITKFIRDNK